MGEAHFGLYRRLEQKDLTVTAALCLVQCNQACQERCACVSLAPMTNISGTFSHRVACLLRASMTEVVKGAKTFEEKFRSDMFSSCFAVADVSGSLLSEKRFISVANFKFDMT